MKATNGQLESLCRLLDADGPRMRGAVASVFMISGYVASACFLLFTGAGSIAQVRKLAQRTAEWRAEKLDREAVCDGLLPMREIWAYAAYVLFVMSGMTRAYFDYFLVCSRLPVILLTTIVLWYLQYHQVRSAKTFYSVAVTGNLLLVAMLGVSAAGIGAPLVALRGAVDGVLVVVTAFLFYGKLLQAFTMYRDRRSRGVSLVRELGLVAKDGTGLWYALTVGSELRWVAVTHIVSGVSSLVIGGVKVIVEREAPERACSRRQVSILR